MGSSKEVSGLTTIDKETNNNTHLLTQKQPAQKTEPTQKPPDETVEYMIMDV